MQKKKIIAVDFDGTLVKKAKYPSFGSPNEFLFDKLISLQKQGAKVILFTCRTGEDLKKAVIFCEQMGLVFDAVNQNIKTWDGEICTSEKVYADIYIDDKSVNPIPFSEIPFDLQSANWRKSR